MPMLFMGAKNVQHPIYGECRMEIWRVIPETPKNTVQQPAPEYLPLTVTYYYQHGQIVDQEGGTDGHQQNT